MAAGQGGPSALFDQLGLSRAARVPARIHGCRERSTDVTGVAVSNDTGGNILFHVTLANFTPESWVAIFLDTDKNASTGDDGADYVLALDHSADPAQTGWVMGQWDGTAWTSAPQRRHGAVASSDTYADFRVNRSELGGTSGFAFQVWTKRYVADAVTGRDYAPDGHRARRGHSNSPHGDARTGADTDAEAGGREAGVREAPDRRSRWPGRRSGTRSGSTAATTGHP